MGSGDSDVEVDSMIGDLSTLRTKLDREIEALEKRLGAKVRQRERLTHGAQQLFAGDSEP